MVVMVNGHVQPFCDTGNATPPPPFLSPSPSPRGGGDGTGVHRQNGDRPRYNSGEMTNNDLVMAMGGRTEGRTERRTEKPKEGRKEGRREGKKEVRKEET